MLIATVNRGSGAPADFDFLKDHDGDVMGFNEPDMYDSLGASRLSRAAHAHLPIQISFRCTGMHSASAVCCMLHACMRRLIVDYYRFPSHRDTDTYAGVYMHLQEVITVRAANLDRINCV